MFTDSRYEIAHPESVPCRSFDGAKLRKKERMAARLTHIFVPALLKTLAKMVFVTNYLAQRGKPFTIW